MRVSTRHLLIFYAKLCKRDEIILISIAATKLSPEILLEVQRDSHKFECILRVGAPAAASPSVGMEWIVRSGSGVPWWWMMNEWMNLLCTTVSWLAVVKSGFFSLTASTFGYGWTVGYDIHITLSTRYTCDNDNWTIEQAPLPPRYPFLATCPLLRSYFSGTFDQSYLRYSLCMGIWKGMTFRLKHDETLVVKWAYGYWTWVFKMGQIYLRVSSILPKARVFVRLGYPFLLPTDTYTHLPTHPDEVK